MMFRWLSRLFGCRHSSMLRVRVQGVQSFQCQACGHTQPQVERSQAEHKRIGKAGAVKALKAQRVGIAKVASLQGRRRGNG